MGNGVVQGRFIKGGPAQRCKVSETPGGLRMVMERNGDTVLRTRTSTDPNSVSFTSKGLSLRRLLEC